MDGVIIEVDPHKLPVTIEARDTGSALTPAAITNCWESPDDGQSAFGAVEGANGIGNPLVQRLLASGSGVLDVPAKLAARARVFDTGQGRRLTLPTPM